MYGVKDAVCYQTEVHDSNVDLALNMGAVAGTCSTNGGYTVAHGN